MISTKRKPLEYYVEKIEKHLLKKFPQLEFELVKHDDREATIYYRPFSEETDSAIVRRTGGIATDALVDDDYNIHIQPAA